MRGLSTRIDFTRAKLHLAIDPNSDSEDMTFALFDAENEGYGDYQNGIYRVPELFRDEPRLVKAWKCGQRIAEENAEMAECQFCNDGTGNPCPDHG